ncbi:MAG: hypothetical protein AB1797_08260 [bacterium]
MSLKEAVVNQIDGYLEGKVSKKEASSWAIRVITERCFGVDEILLEDAVTALAGLHDDNERWDVSKEDMIFFKECLEGKRPYLVRVEFLPEEKEKEEMALAV